VISTQNTNVAHLHTHSHTHKHTMLIFSHTTSLSHTHLLTHAHTHSLTFTHALTLTHALSLTHTLNFSYTHIISHSLTHTHTHFTLKFEIVLCLCIDPNFECHHFWSHHLPVVLACSIFKSPLDIFFRVRINQTSSLLQLHFLPHSIFQNFLGLTLSSLTTIAA